MFNLTENQKMSISSTMCYHTDAQILPEKNLYFQMPGVIHM